MKIKFIKTTLTLTLLLMATAPAAVFAGTSCDKSIEANYFGKQEGLQNEVCFKLDCGSNKFVPKKNQSCGNQNQQQCGKWNSNCDNNGNNSSNSNNNCNKNNNNCNNGNNNCNNGGSNCEKPDAPNRPDKPNKPDVPSIPDKPNKPDVPNIPDTPNKPETPNKPDAPNVNLGAYEKQVVNLVNQERAKVGLAPLSINSKLGNVAEVKAEDMRDSNYFSHNSPNYGSPFDMMKKFGITYSSAGENIAKGQKTAESVMNAWMNSSGHKANILSGNFEQIGVGYTTDSKGNTYWVQMFIR